MNLFKTFQIVFFENLSINMCAAVYVHLHMFEYTCMSVYAWIPMHTCMWPLEDDNRYLPHSSSVFCVEAGYHADPGAIELSSLDTQLGQGSSALTFPDQGI